MSVRPHPEAGTPGAADHNPGGERDALGAGSTDGASKFAHGTHGRGDSREVMNDEKAVDSGDRQASRRGGSGPDEAPDPKQFAEQLEGRMGGAGWGNESAGGSSVDRRHKEN